MQRFAKPSRFMSLAEPCLPWLTILTLSLLGWGLYLALWVSPADYQQGDTVRIMYVHVPAAWMALFVYTAMAIASFVALIWRHPLAEIAAQASAPIGAVFTLCALATGSLWGKPMWGTWWIWDARLTSELILLFLYLGVIALHNAFEDKALAGKAAGILTLVGVINLPIIKYSVEWWNTLHQGSTVSNLGKPSMSVEMLWPFVFCFLGFALLVSTLICIRFRSEILIRNSIRPWVKALVIKQTSSTKAMEQQ